MPNNECNDEILNLSGIILYRIQCPACGEYELSGKKTAYCEYCDRKLTFRDCHKERKIGVVNDINRIRLSASQKNDILDKQNNRCYWCGREFGTEYMYHFRFYRLTPHFDHVIPFSLIGNGGEENIVASCNVCNLWKSSKVFHSEAEIQDYLLEKWRHAINNGDIIFE